MKQQEIKAFESSEQKLLSEREQTKLHKALKRKKKNKVLNVLTLEDLEQWVDIPPIPFKNKNDKVKEVVLLMAYLGLRVDEAISFDWTTMFETKNSIAFKVIGKGNKERIVHNVLKDDYINLKAFGIKSGKIPNIDYPITRFGIRWHLNAKSVSLKWKWKVNPHDLRRAFASGMLYEKGMNKLALQELLGHAFYSTTEKYLRKDPRTVDTLLEDFYKNFK